MGTTGTCQKCLSEIPAESVRCPACGYEPGALTGWKVVLIGLTGVIGYVAVLALFMVVTGLADLGTGPVELTFGFAVGLVVAIAASWWQFRQVTRPRHPTKPTS